MQVPSISAAIGAGISTSLGSAGVHSDTAAEWIYFCVKAAMEARAAVLENPPPPQRSCLDDLLDELEALPDNPSRVGFQTAPPKPIEPRPTTLVGKELTEAANHAATVAFRCCLPQLTNRRRVQAYIACIAAGVGHGFIAAKDVNSLLYAAQLALTAYPKRRANSARKATIQ